MPSVSSKQHNFMLMSLSQRGRSRLRSMGRKPAPLVVAKEFIAGDKRKKRKKRKR